MSWVTLFLWCFEVLFFIFNSYSLIIVCLDIGLYVVHWIWICMFSSVLRFGEFGPCVLAPLLNFQIYIIYVLLLWSLVKSPKSHNYSQLPSFTFFLPLFQFQMHNLQESCFSTCSNLLLNYLTINDFSAFSPPPPISVTVFFQLQNAFEIILVAILILFMCHPDFLFLSIYVPFQHFENLAWLFWLLCHEFSHLYCFRAVFCSCIYSLFAMLMSLFKCLGGLRCDLSIQKEQAPVLTHRDWWRLLLGYLSNLSWDYACSGVRRDF